MANKVENPREPRPPFLFVSVLLLLGTVFAWWGTRDYRRLFQESLREPIVARAVALPQAAPQDAALLDRGFQISTRQCAGCHEMAVRSSAPSYREIVSFYRRGLPAATGNRDLCSRLASAVTHPQPGWGNFAPGPAEPGLSVDDRIAVAGWILNSFERNQNPAEGAGR